MKKIIFALAFLGLLVFLAPAATAGHVWSHYGGINPNPIQPVIIQPAPLVIPEFFVRAPRQRVETNTIIVVPQPYPYYLYSGGCPANTFCGDFGLLGAAAGAY